MNIFLLNFILMIFEATFLIYKPKNNPKFSEEDLQRKKKWFVILQCVQWILISWLRADSVGADTSNYMRLFDMDKHMSWTECIEYFKSYYLEDKQTHFEPGYLLFEKLVSSIWDHHGFYKFFVAAFFMPFLGRFVYKHSDDPFIAFMLYAGLFYNLFSLTGYRQVISVAIGVLWAYDYVEKRKFIPFLILVLIASTIHKSTLIFLPFYFVSRIKITKPYTTAAIVAVLVMIVFRNQVFNYVKVIVGYDQYSGHETGFTQRNFLFLFAILSALAIWRYKYVIADCPEAKIYYNGLIMSAAMIPFAMVSPTSMRLVYNFGFMLMMLVPKVFQSFNGKHDQLIAYGVSGAVFAYFIATKSVPYEFFWQAL